MPDNPAPLISTYNRLPISFEFGQGSWLYDENKTPYLDMLCGISVTSLGHAHPKLIDCLSQQSKKLWHTSNLYHIKKQEKLATKLCSISHMSSAFICNSGAEANETAIKLARLYGNKKGIHHPTILSFEHSFHGRTMATLTATGKKSIQQGFEPLLPGFCQAKLNDQESVLQQLDQHPNIVAILIEPVQGEGGIHPASIEFLQFLQAICDKKDLLLMLDEIQCGLARTGTWFAHHQAQIPCDVMTTAKALGNGFPIGACLVNHKALDIFSVGHHGTTFGGNPMASAIAHCVLQTMEEENILKKVEHNAQLLHTLLANLQNKYAFIQQIRQKGLMIGIDIDTRDIEISNIVPTALKNQLLINLTGNNTIRMLPPLNCHKEEIQTAIERLEQSLLKLQK